MMENEKIEKKIEIEKKNFLIEMFMNDYILIENVFLMYLMNSNMIM
jgi:hypothetical protein